MSPAALTTYLHDHIPLSAALGAEVVTASATEVVLSAPFGPNVNHRSTVFGGSLSALAILASWTWLHRHTRGQGGAPTLVIQSQAVDFLAPATGEIHAVCAAPPAAALERFDRVLERYRRARLELTATVSSDGLEVARFRGEFVALNAPPPDFG